MVVCSWSICRSLVSLCPFCSRFGMIHAPLLFVLGIPGWLAVDTQNWHDEGFLDNLGRTGQTSPLNRSDRSRQVCQIANWTAPLRRSRRDDRNAYIERLIRSPDEGVMPPRRPAPRSDRSRAVRPVQRPVRPVRNAQSELGVVF